MILEIGLLFSYQGTCYFDNTKSNGYIAFRTTDVQAIPELQIRLVIYHEAIMCQWGTPLRIYNSSNTNYNEIKQNLFVTEILNNAFDSTSSTHAIKFKTKTNTSKIVDNVNIQPNKTTIHQNLQVDGNITFTNAQAITNINQITFTDSPIVKIQYYTNYYSQILGGIFRMVVPSDGTHRFMVGTNDEVIISETVTRVNNNIQQAGTNIIEQTGTGTNTFKTSTFDGIVQIKENIEFTYTTLITPTSTELGHVRTAISLPANPFFLTTNVARNCVIATLDIGVWSVTFQVCYKCTASGTSTRFEYGLSTTSATFDNLFIDRQFGGAHGSNEFVYNRTTRTFTVLSGTITIYAVIRLFFTSGTYQAGGTTIGTSDYISMQAVRIA